MENYLIEYEELINIYNSDDSYHNYDYDHDEYENHADINNHDADYQENISNTSITKEEDPFIPKINYDPMEDF